MLFYEWAKCIYPTKQHLEKDGSALNRNSISVKLCSCTKSTILLKQCIARIGFAASPMFHVRMHSETSVYNA
jgi:hypothetical protein